MLYKTNSSLAYTQSNMAISIHFQGTAVPCARLAMALWGTCKRVGGLWSSGLSSEMFSLKAAGVLRGIKKWGCKERWDVHK